MVSAIDATFPSKPHTRDSAALRARPKAETRAAPQAAHTILSFLPQIGENLRRVIPGIHLSIYALDPSLLIYQIANASGIARLQVITCPVGQANSALRIAQQGEREGVFVGKRSILLLRVETYSDNRDTELPKVLHLVAEPASLQRSSRRIGFYIEPQ